MSIAMRSKKNDFCYNMEVTFLINHMNDVYMRLEGMAMKATPV